LSPFDRRENWGSVGLGPGPDSVRLFPLLGAEFRNGRGLGFPGSLVAQFSKGSGAFPPPMPWGATCGRPGRLACAGFPCTAVRRWHRCVKIPSPSAPALGGEEATKALPSCQSTSKGGGMRQRRGLRHSRGGEGAWPRELSELTLNLSPSTPSPLWGAGNLKRKLSAGEGEGAHLCGLCSGRGLTISKPACSVRWRCGKTAGLKCSLNNALCSPGPQKVPAPPAGRSVGASALAAHPHPN
jgi:hypothetical protein